MRVKDIKDRESLQAWLEALPQGTEAEREEARRWAVAIAHRAAMRVLPVFWGWSLSAPARKREVTALPILRSSLVSGVAAIRLTSEINSANAFAARAIHVPKNALALRRAQAYQASNAVEATSMAADVAAAFDTATYVANAVGAVGFSTTNSARRFKMVRADCSALSQNEALDLMPLWQDENRLTQLWADTSPQILAQGEGWRFWVDWYDNALHGRPQDDDLLTKIALIASEDWDKGADHVNALIRRIIEQHRLANEARALKEEVAQLKRQLDAIEQRSHNNPPELVDYTIATREQVTIIWAVLDKAEQELEKPDPDPGTLARVGQLLIDTAKAIASYCASLGHLAMTSAVKTAAAATTGIIIASQSERLQAFGQALLQFARSLGN